MPVSQTATKAATASIFPTGSAHFLDAVAVGGMAVTNRILRVLGGRDFTEPRHWTVVTGKKLAVLAELPRLARLLEDYPSILAVKPNSKT